LNLVLQAKLCTLTVTDEEGLQHVNQEMEAKAVAPFISDRFVSTFSLSLSLPPFTLPPPLPRLVLTYFFLLYFVTKVISELTLLNKL